MKMLSLMSISELRTELESLRRDLDLHLEDVEARVELYKTKLARVDALEAFINAQFAISEMEQRVNAANIRPKNKNAAKRRWRQKKKSHAAELKPVCLELPPPATRASTVAASASGLNSNSLNRTEIENFDISIIAEGNQNRKRKRSAPVRRNAKRAKLLELKIENIKQEIE